MIDAASEERRGRVLFLVLAGVMLAALPWLVHPYYEADKDTNDASMYILSAQALLRGEGYAYLGQPFIVRPPALSVLLAPILAWRGLDFGLMHLVVSLFGVAGALLLHLWTRERLGPWLAAALSLCLWLNPGYQHFCNQVMTDVPGSTCILVALLLERWAARGPSWRRDALLGAWIGLSTYMRSVAVLVLPAILAARVALNLRAGTQRVRWLDFLRVRAAALALATVAVMAPWSVRNALVHAPAPEDQNFVYSYSTGLLHVDAGDPSSPLRSLADVASVVPKRAAAVLDLLGGRLEGRGSASVLAKALGLWVTACVAVLLLRAWRSAEFLFFGIGAVLLVYFGFQVRLGLPMYVVGLCAWAEVNAGLAARFVGAARARALLCAAVLGLTALDFQPHKDWAELQAKFAGQQAQAAAFRAALSDDARVAARAGWHHSLFLGRPVWSLRFVIDRAERRELGKKRVGLGRMTEVIEPLLDRYRIDTVIVDPDPSEQDLLPYLYEKYGMPAEVGKGWVFRVRP